MINSKLKLNPAQNKGAKGNFKFKKSLWHFQNKMVSRLAATELKVNHPVNSDLKSRNNDQTNLTINYIKHFEGKRVVQCVLFYMTDLLYLLQPLVIHVLPQFHWKTCKRNSWWKTGMLCSFNLIHIVLLTQYTTNLLFFIDCRRPL